MKPRLCYCRTLLPIIVTPPADNEPILYQCPCKVWWGFAQGMETWRSFLTEKMRDKWVEKINASEGIQVTDEDKT